MKQSHMNKLIAAALTCLISLITITPLCGFLFQCGCNWPLLGLDTKCNYYEMHAVHTCPWCTSMITGVMSTGSATLFGVLAAVLMPILPVARSENEIAVRTLLGFSVFVITALLAAIIAAAWQGYPFGIGTYTFRGHVFAAILRLSFLA